VKLLKKTIDSKGHVQIICEKDILGVFKKKIEFVSLEVSKQGFRLWKYSHNNVPVDEEISYKLDSWCNNKTLLTDIEEYIVYCSLGCPLRKELDSCVFAEAKAIEDIDDRCDYIRNLKKSEKNKMYKHHKKCFINIGGTIKEWQ